MEDLQNLLIQKDYQKLTILDISNNKISAHGIPYIFNGLSINNSIKSLNLSQNNFKKCPTKIAEISYALTKNKTLNILNMSNCKITDKIACEIAKGLEINLGIKTLILSNNFIEDLGAKSIGFSLVKNKNLLELDLSSNLIGDEGCQGISYGIKENKNIEIINLANNKIYDISASTLLDAVSKNNKLKKLKLELNTIKIKHINEITNYLQKNIGNERLIKHQKYTREYKILHNSLKNSVNFSEVTTEINKEKELVKTEISKNLQIIHIVKNKENTQEIYLKTELEKLINSEQNLDDSLEKINKEIHVFSNAFLF